MYDMLNIFEVFLPQLLRYPNATDPLNGEAAALFMREPKGYEAKVKGELFECLLMGAWLISTEYVSRYATREHIEDAGGDTDESDEMSSVGSYDEQEDDEPAGTMEEV